MTILVGIFVREPVTRSADPVSDVISGQKTFIKEVFKIDIDKDLPASPGMDRAIERLMKMSDSLVRIAKQQLDIGAVTLITELYARDNQVRSIEGYVFRDSSGFDFRSPQYPASALHPISQPRC